MKHTRDELIRDQAEPIERSDKYNFQEKKSSFTYGYVKWIDREERYALIREEVSNKQIYLQFRNIDSSGSTRMNENIIDPVLSEGNRVRFQVRPNSRNNKLMTAYDVQHWNGSKICLLHYKDVLKIALKARALLGHRCYDIINDQQDAATMSKEILKAYEECNRSTEWARGQLKDSNIIIKECKTELGNEIFDILENIYQIDNVQRKVDNAFLRCKRTLKELELLGVRE